MNLLDAHLNASSPSKSFKDHARSIDGSRTQLVRNFVTMEASDDSAGQSVKRSRTEMEAQSGDGNVQQAEGNLDLWFAFAAALF
jgi:hypothetical protein